MPKFSTVNVVVTSFDFNEYTIHFSKNITIEQLDFLRNSSEYQNCESELTKCFCYSKDPTGFYYNEYLNLITL